MTEEEKFMIDILNRMFTPNAPLIQLTMHYMTLFGHIKIQLVQML